MENAVNIALDAIARGRRGTNVDEFVNDVLKTVAATLRPARTSVPVHALDDALKELDTREAEQREIPKRSRLTLLEAGIAQDILRRNASSAAHVVSRQTVAIEHPDDAYARFEALRKRQDEFYVEGRDKGVNFSLEIAIEIARLSVAAAHDADQRGSTLNDFGLALQSLGERESGTARLDEAIGAYREALKEYTRERTARMGHNAEQSWPRALAARRA